jgi:hypothetical protein
MLNPLIAEDLNAGHGATSGRLSVRESAMNVLHFIGHLSISALGVGVAAAVLTYAVVLPSHLFFPWAGAQGCSCCTLLWLSASRMTIRLNSLRIGLC